jgi:hypothetical protein
MFHYILKFVISALVIVFASEIAKRSTVLSAIIIALPLVSLITFIWIYFESNDIAKIARLSEEILYFGLATVPLFLILPYMLRSGYSFLMAMLVSCAASAISMLIVKFVFLKT